MKMKQMRDVRILMSREEKNEEEHEKRVEKLT